jgi:lysine 2,3-aminomutase
MTRHLNSAASLVEAGLLDPAIEPQIGEIARRYAISISPDLESLIEDCYDPIGRQFVPDVRELQHTPEELTDPIGDMAHSPVAGIVHRHADRVLFKVVSACPVYCRFCFRRETVGPGNADALSQDEIERAVSYIAAHEEIWEVIFTGGDPFILSPRRIREISGRLAAIGHVKVLRWHTRVPVVAPARVTQELIDALRMGRATTWIALHANHPREFSDSARAAIARLIDAGIPLCSQSVLLKGVNDDADTLEALMRGFVENRIKPYYLHHPDLAPGTSHFRMTIDEGLSLMSSLRTRLSGLALPTYVLDIPGGAGKVPLESRDAEKLGRNSWRIRDHAGNWHVYPPVCD